VQQASVHSDADVLQDMEAGGHETILLVEDEDGLREAATEYLTARGYSVISARDGEEAINIAGHLTSKIDLLLTDVVMPGLVSGPELARRLVEVRPDLRVLYMSGYTDSTIVQQGLADPARQFMQKPFSFRLLTKRVREILEHPVLTISA
jgi:DNA-binding response OmpR family regulator